MTTRVLCGVTIALLASCLPSHTDAFMVCQSQCSGCCTVDGTCFAGGDISTCGRRGALCQVCDPGTQCQDGQCQPRSAGGGFGGGAFGGGFLGFGGGAGGGQGVSRFAEPFLTTTYRPAPVTGGTLTLVNDSVAVVSDPDRERIVVVDLAASGVQGFVQLPAGSRPARAVVDEAGKVHVVLRGTGRVLHLDPLAVTTAGTGVLGTDEVCAEPRGIAVDGAELVVACRNGELVRFTPGGPRSVSVVGDDLRDVLARADGVAVTSFRAPSVKIVGSGAVMRPAVPSSLPLAPDVAWRTVEGPGGTYMLHQLASTEALTTASLGGPGGQSAYGGSSPSLPGCQAAVVRPALSRFATGGAVETLSLSSTLPGGGAVSVDLAVASSRCGGPQGCTVAVVAGTNGAQLYPLGTGGGTATGGRASGGGSPSPTPRSDDGGIPALACPERSADGGRSSSSFLVPFRQIPGNFSGVAFTSTGTPVLHERGDSKLLIVRDDRIDSIQLFSDGVDSAGSRLFHTAHLGGAAVACASCHPEGAEDGHTWRVNGTVRRTQTLEGGVMDRAPFHWAADLPTLTHLMGDTFTQRMGVELPPGEFVDSLASWLNTIPAARGKTVSPALVAAGHAAFVKAGCDDCHVGEQLTTGVVADVGTGRAFKAPSLRGVSARGPWMHDGCARTLHERFIPACGGSAHGNPGVLDATERDALVAYLESL